MKSDLDKKLKLWEGDDSFEETGNIIGERIAKKAKSNYRMDMLLGSTITSLLWASGLLVLHVAGII